MKIVSHCAVTNNCSETFSHCVLSLAPAATLHFLLSSAAQLLPIFMWNISRKWAAAEMSLLISPRLPLTFSHTNFLYMCEQCICVGFLRHWNVTVVFMKIKTWWNLSTVSHMTSFIDTLQMQRTVHEMTRRNIFSSPVCMYAPHELVSPS